MRCNRRLIVPLAVAVLLVLGVDAARASSTIGVTTDEAAEDTASDALKQFTKAIKTYRMAEVERSIKAFDEVYADVESKTTKKIDKAIIKLFKTKPRAAKEVGEDTREELMDAYMLGIGLVFERESGAEIMRTGLKQAHVKDWPEMRASFIEGLGYRKDPKSIGLLIDHLDDPSPLVSSASATGLGELSEESQPIRRQAVKAILDNWSEAAEAARREGDRKKKTTAARDYLADIEGPFELALQDLTRKRHKGEAAWSEWFTKSGGTPDW